MLDLYEVHLKNFELIKDLQDKRKTFVDIDTNKVKRRLNKIIFSNNNSIGYMVFKGVTFR